MPKISVADISKHAKRTRKPGEKWLSAIKRSSRELKGSKKAAPKKRKVGRVKVRAKVKAKGSYQTGSSSKLHDKRFAAKAPGKRKSKSGRTYYERRKNRSDMPGTLSGVATGSLRSEVKRRADADLAAGLLARDKATTLKQHKAAMKRIAAARKQLKAF
jgi:hypothetical protein